MAEVKKEVAKKEEVKAAKDEVVVNKEVEKKIPAKKTTTKAATTKKATTKKSTAKKVNEKIFIQFNGNEIELDAIKSSVDKILKAEKVKASEVKIYIKPEDNKAYFVADAFEGSVDL